EDQREIIKRNLGWKTEFDMNVEEAQRRFGDFIMGSDPTSRRYQATRGLVNWFSQQNPLGFLRGLAFDLKLGLWNPVQLFLQAGTFLAINAIDPGIGFKSIPSGYMLRSYLLNENVLGHFIKSGTWKMAGFESAEEFETFMRAAKNSGYLTI